MIVSTSPVGADAEDGDCCNASSSIFFLRTILPVFEGTARYFFEKKYEQAQEDRNQYRGKFRLYGISYE